MRHAGYLAARARHAIAVFGAETTEGGGAVSRQPDRAQTATMSIERR
jgi:hypothetical protein